MGMCGIEGASVTEKLVLTVVGGQQHGPRTTEDVGM